MFINALPRARNWALFNWSRTKTFQRWQHCNKKNGLSLQHGNHLLGNTYSPYNILLKPHFCISPFFQKQLWPQGPVSSFLKVLWAEDECPLDEGPCPSKGDKWNFGFITQLSTKIKKLYQFCESSSGYCVAFDIYDGTEGCAVFSEAVGVLETACETIKIVVGVMARAGLLEKGHKLYLDEVLFLWHC